MEVDQERVKLEKLAEELATCEDDESQEELMGEFSTFLNIPNSDVVKSTPRMHCTRGVYF